MLTGCAGWLLVRAALALPLPLIIRCFQLLLKLSREGSKHLRVHLVEKRFKVKRVDSIWQLAYTFHTIDYFQIILF